LNKQLQGRLHHVKLGANAPKKILGGFVFDYTLAKLGGKKFFLRLTPNLCCIAVRDWIYTHNINRRMQ